MINYNGATGSNIGTLLRMIAEEKSNQPAMIPPASEVSSPIRGVVEGPLQAPESVGTSKNVSLRPESAVNPTPPNQTGGIVPPAPTPVAQPIAPVSSPVSPMGASGITAAHVNQGAGISQPISASQTQPRGVSVSGLNLSSSVNKPAGVATPSASPVSSPQPMFKNTTISAPRSNVGGYSIGGPIQNVANAAEGLGTAIGTKVMPKLSELADVGSKVAGRAVSDIFNPFASLFSQMIPTVKNLGRGGVSSG